MKVLLIALVAVLALASSVMAGGPPDDFVQKTIDVIRKQCPQAAVDVRKNGFAAKYGTMQYTLHSVAMTGEVSKQTYQEEGPDYKGFMLDVSLLDGLYQGQAAVPQTLRGPYFATYLNAMPAGAKHYEIRFSYGSRLDPELKKAIFAALGQDAFLEASQRAERLREEATTRPNASPPGNAR